ncbi:MAG: gluconate 2-dehydrogenase subunit 3 family protein [Acidobacteria bacterium]|nr:gluconate 2-dehydrogenase subunit 3 family protein [Acidobacteriota bacterium]
MAQKVEQMEERTLSRREFVRVVRNGAVILIIPQTLRSHLVGRPSALVPQEQIQSSYPYKFFTAEEAASVEAMSARIIPSDQTPGAREAKAVRFIDHMLATEYKIDQVTYRDGLRRLNEVSQSRFSRLFASLNEADQDGILIQMERRGIPDWESAGDFFSLVRGHTIEGLFSDPKHQGNARGVGWRLVGLSV